MDIPNRSAEMLQYVPRYYSNSRHYQAQNNAKGKEFDIIRAITDDLPNQLNPQTATWGLVLWEEFLDLDGENKSIEERRNQIILKSLTSYITPISLERLLKSITKTEVWVTNNVAPYTFSIEISTDNNVAVNFDNIVTVVEDVKPAHLAYETYFSSNAAVVVSIETKAVAKWPLMAGEIVSGVSPGISWPARIIRHGALITGDGTGIKVDYDITGTKPDTNMVLEMREVAEETFVQGAPVKVRFGQSGEENAGEHPDSNIVFNSSEAIVAEELDVTGEKVVYALTGVETSGAFPTTKYIAGVRESGVSNTAEGGGFLVKYDLSGEDTRNGKLERNGIDTETSAESIRVLYPMCGEEL